jgi:hypothetical protein
METFEQHPNLSPEITAAIIKSEIDGGIYLKDLPPGGFLKVTTKHRVYTITKTLGGTELYIKGHPVYCSTLTKANIHGSTFGGSMIKMDYVGRGMYLEFSTAVHPKSITTSKIVDVEEIA